MVSRSRKWMGVVLAAFLALSVLGGFASAGAASAADDALPVVEITAGQTVFSAGESVLVQVTVSNPSARPVKVLKWFTPVEDVEEPLFAVTVDGTPVSYLGAYYKRPAPKGEDYITLKSGERLTRSVDLAAYYDLSATGTYTVRYSVESATLYSEKGAGQAKRRPSLHSNELTLSIEGRQSGPQLAVEPMAVTGATTFNKCTTTQQNTLRTARAEASNMAAGAYSYLQAGNQGARYTTWFGAYSATRYNTVSANFNKISGAMDAAAVKFDCGCKKKYYAYVYPTQPYNIYVCSVFWSAPMVGTDSKAGTLIHEMSHFNVVAGTDDYVYGQAGAKNLAITNPNQAVDNADNHEYFAENTPALP